MIIAQTIRPTLGNRCTTIHTRYVEGDDIVVDTREDNDHNIIENEAIILLIHDTCVSINKNAPANEIYENIHDVTIIDKVKKNLRQVFSLIFCC